MEKARKLWIIIKYGKQDARFWIVTSKSVSFMFPYISIFPFPSSPFYSCFSPFPFHFGRDRHHPLPTHPLGYVPSKRCVHQALGYSSIGICGIFWSSELDPCAPKGEYQWTKRDKAVLLILIRPRKPGTIGWTYTSRSSWARLHYL